MKFIILFIHLVYSELHKLTTTYTGIYGQTTSGTPEFSAVSTLDDHQIDYYDSNINKLIPRQDWMKDYASTELWTEYTEIREQVQQIYRNSTPVIMEIFNQSDGLHTYQRMYGCEWDDETGDSQGFDEYGYDGQDFISLDLKENRYITSVPQGNPTVMKWNNDTAQLEFLKRYYDHECVYWLKEFLYLSKATFEKTEPRVSLLQKNSDYYTCHVTGFLFRNTIISWRKNGQALSDSSGLVESGDTLPNGDGTFQRRVTLYVHPYQWKKNQFSCVVEHKSLNETIQKILTEDQTKRSKSASDASNIMYLAAVIITVTVALIALFVHWKPWKKLKAYNKKITTIYLKSKPSPEPAPAQKSRDSQDSRDPLLSTPSNECSSPTEDSDLESISSLFLHRDEQNLFPEASPSQFLTGGPIFTTLDSFEVQETSKDL